MDTLALWGPSRDAALAGIDWGTVAPGSSFEVALRVKNRSTVYVARDVVVAVTDAWHYLSADGHTWTATVELGDLPCLALTGRLWLRRVVPPGAPAGAGSAELTATAGSWTLP